MYVKKFLVSIAVSALALVGLTVSSSVAVADESVVSKTLAEWFPNEHIRARVEAAIQVPSSGLVSQEVLAGVKVMDFRSQQGILVNDISEFAPLTGLTKLLLFGQGVKNLEGVRGFPKLLELVVQGPALQSLKGLEDAVGLQSLTLGELSEGFAADDHVLAPLRSLTSLKELVVRETSLTEVHFAHARLPKSLTFISLPNNRIGEVAPFVDLPELAQLDLVNNRVASLAGISKLTKLTTLALGSAAGSDDLDPLTDWQNRVTDYSEIDLYVRPGKEMGLDMDRAMARMSFTRDHETGGYIADLSKVRVPKSGAKWTVDSERQGVKVNTSKNRLEVSAADYAKLKDSLAVVQLSMRKSDINHVFGRLWLFADEIPEFTVTYKDGADGAAFGEQRYSALRGGAGTPQFSGTPRRDGYMFQGWEPKVPALVTADATFTAVWAKAPAFTVTYTDGAAGEVFGDQVYSGLRGGTASPAFAGVPERRGYSFEGWAPVVSEKVTADATYTATWAKIGAPAKPSAPVAEGGIAAPGIPIFVLGTLLMLGSTFYFAGRKVQRASK